MPRAVSPWTWGKALRDHGPSDRDFLCAMLILRTFTDSGGVAYPSLRTWATASRMSVNTLRKHLDVAVSSGWLTVESLAGGDRRERVRNVYRCSVPEDVPLESRDAEIADALPDSPTLGSPLQGVSVSPMSDTDHPRDARSVSAHGDTDHEKSTAIASPPADATASVSNDAPICVKAPDDLYQKPGPSVSAKSRNALNAQQVAREVLKFSDRSSEVAPANARRPDDDQREDEQKRRAKARKHLAAAPDTADARIASTYRLTLDQVASVRAELTERM